VLSMETQELFKYNDYRKVLTDHFRQKKEKHPYFSYRQWAKTLGVAGPSVITNVVNGHRNPGKVLCQKLCTYFKFNHDETNYFETLVLLEKGKKSRVSHLNAIEKLVHLSPEKTGLFLDEMQFSSISDWYFIAIKEMVNLADFVEDPIWIQNRLRSKVSINDIKFALNRLIDLKVLVRNDFGKLIQNSEYVYSASNLLNIARRTFHKQMIESAKDALDTIDVSEREISGLTLTIKKENYHRLGEVISKFKKMINSEFDEAEGSDTYQLNIQFFPLTEGISS